MPSLEEIRQWLQGEDVDGLPSRSLAWAPRVSTAKGKPSRMSLAERYRKRRDEIKAGKGIGNILGHGGRYTINIDGDDAVLKFGKHKGKSISELANSQSGYLDWILRQEFPEELKDVVVHQKRLLVNTLGLGADLRRIVIEKDDPDDADGDWIGDDEDV